MNCYQTGVWQLFAIWRFSTAIKPRKEKRSLDWTFHRHQNTKSNWVTSSVKPSVEASSPMWRLSVLKKSFLVTKSFWVQDLMSLKPCFPTKIQKKVKLTRYVHNFISMHWFHIWFPNYFCVNKLILFVTKAGTYLEKWNLQIPKWGVSKKKLAGRNINYKTKCLNLFSIFKIQNYQK